MIGTDGHDHRRERDVKAMESPLFVEDQRKEQNGKWRLMFQHPARGLAS